MNVAEGLPKASVESHAKEGAWMLEEDFSYFDPILGVSIMAMAGFWFNLASVPRALWPLCGPHELTLEAAAIHDWIYHHGGLLPPMCVTPRQHVFSRAEADRIFNDIAKLYGAKPWRRRLAYPAVRVFGGPHWKG